MIRTQEFCRAALACIGLLSILQSSALEIDSTEYITANESVKLYVKNSKTNTAVTRNEKGETSPINIAISYTSFPKNVSYYWLKNDQINISEQKFDMPNGKYEINHTGTLITLTILNPTVLDTGNYTLHVMTRQARSTQTIDVHVYQKPILEIMHRKFAKPGDDVTFTCSAFGYPLPKISFVFTPCHESPWKNCSVATTETTSKWGLSGNMTNQMYLRSRTYNIKAVEAGVVHCKASNSVGDAETRADLLVSPMNDGVTLQRVHPVIKDIIVGDQLLIVCSALVYNHTNEITLELKGRKLCEKDGVKVGYSKEMFAWQANFTIDHVTHEHAGKLSCKAKTIESNYETRELYIEVLDPMAPHLKLANFEAFKILQDLNGRLELYCDIVGQPVPMIVWYKNGVRIDKSSDCVKLTDKKLTFDCLNIEDFGMYKCQATNRFGISSRYWEISVRTSLENNLLFYIIVAQFVALIIAIMLFSLFYNKKEKEIHTMKGVEIVHFEEGNLGIYNPKLALNEQAELLPYNKEYEFPMDRLKFGKKLGTGAFGLVLEATATRIMVNEDETTVAVKMVKRQTDNEVMHALISELKIMVHLGQHLNVVNLLGAVTKNIAKRELMIIVEYCRFGSVQNFLQNHRPYFIDQINHETGVIDSMIGQSQNEYTNYDHRNKNKNQNGPVRSVNTTDLVCWASQIANGMEYLASRNVLHGDLATRNILLSDENVVKICDFGLAHSLNCDQYKKKSDTPLPFKWLALECINDNVFSTYSDVWAYGIVLWELFSLGKVPYPGMEANQELYSKLRDGYRMDKPQYANQTIYDIMLNCWYVNPESRPSFRDLKCRFNALLPDEMLESYVKLNEPYMKINAEKIERGNIDYLSNLISPEEHAPAAPLNVSESGTLADSITNIKNESTVWRYFTNKPPNGNKRQRKPDCLEQMPIREPPRVAEGLNFNLEMETVADPKPEPEPEHPSQNNRMPQYMNV